MDVLSLPVPLASVPWNVLVGGAIVVSLPSVAHGSAMKDASSQSVDAPLLPGRTVNSWTPCAE